MNKKQLIKGAIASVLGTVSYTSSAALTTSATLIFDAGQRVVSCPYGGTPPDNCVYFAVTNVTGSYFSMDGDGSGTVETTEKTVISVHDGIHIGEVQIASGSHGGAPDGSESPGIDSPWLFFSNTGMHQTLTGITVVDDDVIGDGGSVKTLDFSGWGVVWNGIPHVSLGGGIRDCGTTTDGICVSPFGIDHAGVYDNGSGLATITCSDVSCSHSSSFTLDYAAVVPIDDASGFGGVPYTLHLEGHVNSIPIPASAWLFGSGLIGLVSVARRRRTLQVR